MRKVDPISKDDAWDNFVSAINNDKTLENYVRALNEFMTFHKLKTYDDFISQPVNEIQDLLKEWINHLKSKNLKGNSISTKLNPVELMLEMNEIVWAKRKIKKMIPKSVHEKGGKRPITSEEIQSLLKTTNDFRMIAIIHFLASTGTRPAVITDPPLQFKHLKKLTDECYTVKIYDESSEGYWAFLTPEASSSMDAYIRTRKLNGEHIDESSYLFATKPNARTRKNDYLSTQSVAKALSKLYKKAGIIREKNGNRFDLAITYGFRKRFNTILKLNNDVNSNIAEKLMAHKRGLDGTYLQPTREECFSEFLKAVSGLTIDPTEKQKIEIQSLEKEKSELSRKIEENEMQWDEIERLRQSVNTLMKERGEKTLSN
ncbi:MAG: tyrosine-type recombinase/integrase [Candidatus Nitrosopumilus sp. bin_68KS]